MMEAKKKSNSCILCAIRLPNYKQEIIVSHRYFLSVASREPTGINQNTAFLICSLSHALAIFRHMHLY